MSHDDFCNLVISNMQYCKIQYLNKIQLFLPHLLALAGMYFPFSKPKLHTHIKGQWRMWKDSALEAKSQWATYFSSLHFSILQTCIPLVWLHVHGECTPQKCHTNWHQKAPAFTIPTAYPCPPLYMLFTPKRTSIKPSHFLLPQDTNNAMSTKRTIQIRLCNDCYAYQTRTRRVTARQGECTYIKPGPTFGVIKLPLSTIWAPNFQENIPKPTAHLKTETLIIYFVSST